MDKFYERAERLAVMKVRSGMTLSELRDFYRLEDMERMDEIFGDLKQMWGEWKLKRIEKEWKKLFRGIPEKEVRSWQMYFYQNPKEAYLWWDYGFTPVEANMWAERGFSPDEAVLWDEYDISCDLAKEWLDAGIHSPEHAYMLLKAGLSPEEVLKWTVIGVTDPYEIIDYVEAGVTPKQVRRRFLRKGAKPNEVKGRSLRKGGREVKGRK